MKPLPVIKKVTQIGQSRLFTIEQLDLEFANGTEVEFERIRANAGRAAMIAAVTDKREILLVREYAAGTERYELQLPKGIIDGAEGELDAANRELAEETGFAARELKKLQTFRVAPGYFQHETDLVMATGLYPQALPSGDEPEELEVVAWPLGNLDVLLAREDFTEARSIAGVLMVLRELEKLSD